MVQWNSGKSGVLSPSRVPVPRDMGEKVNRNPRERKAWREGSRNVFPLAPCDLRLAALLEVIGPFALQKWVVEVGK